MYFPYFGYDVRKLSTYYKIKFFFLFFQIIGYDPFVTAEQCAQFNAVKMELDELWHLADYITLHTPLIESTRST